MKGNIVYAQSGGPTSVINSSLYGAYCEAKKHPEIEKFLGSLNGIEGLINDNLIDLCQEDEEEMSYLLQTPGAALGSARKKLPNDLNDPIYDKIFANVKKHNVFAVLFNGGNDSMDTSNKLAEAAKLRGITDAVFLGVPKTIDNDLAATDHSVGFPSAARMVVNQTLALSIDAHVLPKNKIYIVEVMGRDAGWLTAAASLVPEPYRPDAIVLPEMKQDLDELLAIVKKAYDEKGGAVIAMSEGVAFASIEDAPLDAFGHPMLDGAAHALSKIVKERLGLGVREVIYSTLARANPAYISAVDSEEAQGVGAAAVKAALEGKTACMVAIIRDSSYPYASHYELKPVSEVANVVSLIPSEWIHSYNEFSKELTDYLLPLVQKGIEVRYDENGLFHYTKLKKVKA